MVIKDFSDEKVIEKCLKKSCMQKVRMSVKTTNVP